MIRLILLDDESELREEQAAYFKNRGMSVTEVSTLQEFRQVYPTLGWDIAILDRMLPDGDGMDLVAELRAWRARCGIILFTGRNGLQERVTGYANGADHYLTKPIRLVELGAIVEALARRLPEVPPWQLDTFRWELRTPEGLTLQLTALEGVFLHVLSDNAGKPVSRHAIVDAIGRNHHVYDHRNLDALIRRLRQKVDSAGPSPLPVKTVHGLGYLLSAPLGMVRG